MSNVIKRIELHYKALESLKKKLEARRLAFFEATVKEVERRDHAEASLYANEYIELKKVLEAISYSRIALTFVAIKLESIRDIKDVIYHVSSALKVIKEVSNIIPNLTAMLEGFTDEMSSTLTEITIGYENLMPNIMVNETFENYEEVLERAKICANKRFLLKELTSENNLLQTDSLKDPLLYYNWGKKKETISTLNLSVNEISKSRNIPYDKILCEGVI